MLVVREVGRPVEHQPAGFDERLAVAGEEVFEGRAPGFEEDVGLAGLRDAAARARVGGQRVAVEDGHAVERVAEDARRDHAGDARADDDRVVVDGSNHVGVVPGNGRQRHATLSPLGEHSDDAELTVPVSGAQTAPMSNRRAAWSRFASRTSSRDGGFSTLTLSRTSAGTASVRSGTSSSP